MEKKINIFWTAGFFLPAINATVFSQNDRCNNDPKHHVNPFQLLSQSIFTLYSRINLGHMIINFVFTIYLAAAFTMSELFIHLVKKNKYFKKQTLINPKRHGGGWNPPIGQEMVCHFLQDYTMVTKFLDFIHKHPNYKVVKSFFYYLGRFSRNSAETEPRS